MTTMKAVVFNGTRGNPTENMSIQDIPKPTPATGQVLVRVLEAPVHPSVLAGVSPGMYPGPGANEVCGNEGVGVIAEHGEGCETAPPVGTRVLLAGSVGGSYAEFVRVNAAMLIPVPSVVKTTDAAQFVVNPFTAYLMTRQCNEGEWLVQTAAGSVLGRLILQLAKLRGFKTINLVRRAEQCAELEALGADATICTATDDITKRILEITEGKGAQYCVDAVGGENLSAILKGMAYGGDVQIYGQLDRADVHFPSALFVVKQITLRGYWLAHWMKTSTPQEKKEAFGEMFGLFGSGKLSCPVEGEFDVVSGGNDELVKGIQASVAKGKTGKVLLKFSSE